MAWRLWPSDDGGSMIRQQLGRVSVEVPESVAGLGWLPMSFVDVGGGGRWIVGTDGRFRMEYPSTLSLVYDERDVERDFSCHEESTRRQVQLCGLPACVSLGLSAQVRIDLRSQAGKRAEFDVAWVVGPNFDAGVVPLFGGMLASATIDGEPVFSCSRGEIEETLADVFALLVPGVAVPPLPPPPAPWVDVEEADLDQAVFIVIDIPVYEEDFDQDEIPRDLPLLQTMSEAWWTPPTRWIATVRLDSGQIENWPSGYGPVDVFLKVTSEGRYTLLDDKLEPIMEPREWYVPHGVIPGKWGDYVDLRISDTGKITNWPDDVDLIEFTEEY
jgi:hypothetical protein